MKLPIEANMPQIPKIVDLTKSYVFTDPSAFPDNRGYTQQQDAPTETLPVVAMEGYNFLPTSYGYRSYFGDSSVLDINLLPARCDTVILFQLADYRNVLIALCEDGIWYSEPASISGAAWVPAATYAIPVAGVHYEWSYCLLENVLYCYQQGRQEVWSLDYISFVDVPSFALTFERHVPCTIRNYDLLATMNADATLIEADVGKLCYCYEDSTYYYLEATTPTWVTYSSITHGNFILNMTGQLGMFRANLRLGFWDSANSISWGDLNYKMDFEPSVTTRVGNKTFSGILGRIVTVLPQGSGFVIYSTKNIVGIRFINEIASIWNDMVISDTAGITYPHQACTGATESDHYAFTNTGMVAIGKYNPLSGRNDYQTILPEVYDLLKESGEPVYLDFLQGRYLFISLISPDYITGALHFAFDSTRDVPVRFLYNNAGDEGLSLPDIFIGAQTLSASILDQLGLGTNNAYYRWAAYTYRIALDRNTYLNPVLRDQWGGLIDGPVDNTPSITPAEAAAIVQGTSSYTAPSLEAAFDGNNARIVLPWDMTSQGVPDAYLNLLMDRQRNEWNLLIDIAQADLALIRAQVSTIPAPDITPPVDEPAVASRLILIGTTLAVAPAIPSYESIFALSSSPTTTALTDVLVTMYPDTGIQVVQPWTSSTLTAISNSFSGAFVDIPAAVTEVENITAPGTSAASVTNTPTFLMQRYAGGVGKRYTASYYPNPILIGTAAKSVLNYSHAFASVSVKYYMENSIVVNSETIIVDDNFTIPDSGWSLVLHLVFSLTKLPGSLTSQFSPTLISASVVSITNTSTVYILNGVTSFVGVSNYVDYSQSKIVIEFYTDEIRKSDMTPVSRYLIADLLVASNFAGDYVVGAINTRRPTVTSIPAFSSRLELTSSSYNVEEQPLTATQMSLDWTLGGGTPDTYAYVDGKIDIPGIKVAPTLSLPPYATVTYPGATFLLQDGSPVPIYPEFSGALVLDTHLKKLGKYYGTHTGLVELAPINNNAAALPYTNFGLSAGVMKPDSTIRAFSANPSDSYIKYGLYGLYRQGYTVLQECRLTQRRPLDYSIEVRSSLDGRNEELLYSTAGTYSGDTIAILPVAQSGRWHTIRISGNYDLTGLEMRSTISGRR